MFAKQSILKMASQVTMLVNKMPQVSTNNVTIVRVVEGDKGKFNDILFSGQLNEKRKNVIFFGGDIQNFEEAMRTHAKNYTFIEWSFENVAGILQKRFPGSNTWIVKPATMILNTISVFANFVHSDDVGVPEYQVSFGAVSHLSKLLENCSKRVLSEKCFDLRSHVNVMEQEVILVGFSKGCVVLNQIVHELSTCGEYKSFVSLFEAFYWLDGGHQGNKGTWITDADVLQSLCDLNVRVEVHVTPYQVKDTSRKWIGDEETIFSEILTAKCDNFKETLHFHDQKRSIDNHFKVLLSF